MAESPEVEKGSPMRAERLVELRGFPKSPSFTLGGKNGNVVVSSEDRQVHRGWRAVAVDGKPMQGGEELAAALRVSQRSARYTVTFKPVHEPKAILRNALEAWPSPAGAKPPPVVSRSVSHGSLRWAAKAKPGPGAPPPHEGPAPRSRLAPTDRPQPRRLVAGGAGAPAGAAAAAPAAADAPPGAEGAPAADTLAQDAGGARMRAAELSTGLPPRESVAEPQRALLAALSCQPTREALAPAGARRADPCSRCGGAHGCSACPHYAGERIEHRDAWMALQQGGSGGGEGALAAADGDDGGKTLVGARRVAQPGDGSCLFHSLSHGLGLGSGQAGALRAQIADFIAAHPQTALGDSPLADWVLWEAGVGVPEYARAMRAGHAWGGAIEMAVCALVTGADVRVYERTAAGRYARIAAFAGGAPGGAGGAGSVCAGRATGEAVRLLYSGRIHYDALDTS